MSNTELMAVTNRPVFINKKLENATERLIACSNTINGKEYAIAAILAEIESKSLYSDDGFGSSAEYAEQTFGIKKSKAYSLITIGKDFTRPILNRAGKAIGYCSNLLPAADIEKQDAPLIDFTTRQISIFTGLGRENVLELIDNGSLKPSMTCREISDLIKKIKEAVKSSNEVGENREATEVEEPEQVQVTEITRPESFDKITDDTLIAELRKRGFKVYKGKKEVVIDWITWGYSSLL